MAIQTRRGNAIDFNSNKMLPGEPATVIDGGKIKWCVSPGNVKTIATVEDMASSISDADQIIIDELTAGANAAANVVEGVLDGVNHIIDDNGTYYQLNSADGGMYLKEIAPDTNPPASTTILDNISSLQTDVSNLDANKVAKADIVQTDTVNDSSKVPSSVVTYGLGQEIDAINNRFIETTESVSFSLSGATITGTGTLRKNDYFAQFTSGYATFSGLTAGAWSTIGTVSTVFCPITQVTITISIFSGSTLGYAFVTINTMGKIQINPSLATFNCYMPSFFYFT